MIIWNIFEANLVALDGMELRIAKANQKKHYIIQCYINANNYNHSGTTYEQSNPILNISLKQSDFFDKFDSMRKLLVNTDKKIMGARKSSFTNNR